MIRVWYSLYDRLLQRRGLEVAFAKVRRAAGAPGIDGQRVADFEAKLGEELDRLVYELQSKTYQPKPVRRVTIPKPGGGERLPGALYEEQTLLHQQSGICSDSVLNKPPVVARHTGGS